jgi:hypothetical protein
MEYPIYTVTHLLLPATLLSPVLSCGEMLPESEP